MIRIKRGDTYHGIKATLKRNGAPVNLTGATVRFVMKNNTATITCDASIINPACGLVLVAFNVGDTDNIGIYQAEFEVTYSDGRKETFPSDRYLTVQIVPDLG